MLLCSTRRQRTNDHTSLCSCRRAARQMPSRRSLCGRSRIPSLQRQQRRRGTTLATAHRHQRQHLLSMHFSTRRRRTATSPTRQQKLRFSSMPGLQFWGRHRSVSRRVAPPRVKQPALHQMRGLPKRSPPSRHADRCTRRRPRRRSGLALGDWILLTALRTRQRSGHQGPQPADMRGRGQRHSAASRRRARLPAASGETSTVRWPATAECVSLAMYDMSKTCCRALTLTREGSVSCRVCRVAAT